MHLMYKYVEFISDIYLGYIIFCLYLIYNIKIINVFLLLKKTCIFIYWGKPNGFQYSFVTIYSFCFVIISVTLAQIFTSERKCKRNINVKNILTNNCNTEFNPTGKVFQLN